MTDNPELKIGLACQPFDIYEETPVGILSMTKDDMLLNTLEELLRAWLETSTAIEIGSDPKKIRLLKEVAQGAEVEPTPFIREVYEEVFLQDVWTRARPG